MLNLYSVAHTSIAPETTRKSPPRDGDQREEFVSLLTRARKAIREAAKRRDLFLTNWLRLGFGGSGDQTARSPVLITLTRSACLTSPCHNISEAERKDFTGRPGAKERPEHSSAITNSMTDRSGDARINVAIVD
jgi:hypothetical protein